MKTKKIVTTFKNGQFEKSNKEINRLSVNVTAI